MFVGHMRKLEIGPTLAPLVSEMRNAFREMRTRLLGFADVDPIELFYAAKVSHGSVGSCLLPASYKSTISWSTERSPTSQ